MLNQKTDCIDSIVKTLENTSEWRKTTAARWPDDPRNLRASQVLDLLAAEACNLTDAQWKELSVHFGWSSECWRSVVNQTAKNIGFYNRATKNFDGFISTLIQNLSASKVAA